MTSASDNQVRDDGKHELSFACFNYNCSPNTDTRIGGARIFSKRKVSILCYERSSYRFSL
jgi:hypothetical protein